MEISNPAGEEHAALTSTARAAAKKQKELIAILAFALLAFGLLIFVLINTSQRPTVTPKTSYEPAVNLKTEYKNPFDKNAQYVNPFSKYKNPFDNLK